MRKATFFWLAVLLLASCGQTPQWEFSMSNPSDEELADVPVLISKSEAELQLGIQLDESVMLIDGDNAIPVQLQRSVPRYPRSR